MFSKLFKHSRSDDSASSEGRLAFSNGIDISENPYHHSDKNRASLWESGWREAQEARSAFEKKHTWPQTAARPVRQSQPKYADLDAHVQRFIEINEALGDIGTIFESVGSPATSNSGGTHPLEQIAQNVNELRIPGFFAYHLAQEALSLLNIIAASAALAKKDVEASEKLKVVLCQIDESEPVLRRTVYDMEPYKSMDAKEAIEVIAARLAERKGK